MVPVVATVSFQLMAYTGTVRVEGSTLLLPVYRNIEIPIGRIEYAFSSVPWHPRAFHADTEGQLRRIKYRYRI